jgi:CRP-like cAMP-binding protein
MSHPLIAHFERMTALTEGERSSILCSMVSRTLTKGSHLLREGEYGRETYFLVKGCIKQSTSRTGIEVVTNFYLDGDWIIGFEEPDGEMGSRFDLICMEECELVVGNEEKARSIFAAHPRLEPLARRVMETVLRAQHDQAATFLGDGPDDRYKKLVSDKPGLLQRVPQYDLASYLGIRPETLSRIRRKLLLEERGAKD